MKKLFLLLLLFSLGVSMGFAQAAKTRFAIVGLDHDHVWDRMPTLLKPRMRSWWPFPTRTRN